MLLLWKVFCRLGSALGLTMSCKQTTLALRPVGTHHWSVFPENPEGWPVSWSRTGSQPSCLFISPVIALPRLPQLHWMVLAVQAIEIFLGRTDVALLTLKFFLYVLRIKVCHEGYSLHSREISHHLPHSGMFFGKWRCWNPPNNIYTFVYTCKQLLRG